MCIIFINAISNYAWNNLKNALLCVYVYMTWNAYAIMCKIYKKEMRCEME
jgi:hypothetical protein